jgi:predicted RNase H-like HicB family nuclease
MNQNLQYMVVVEKGTTSYGVYVPDLPGCVAVGETREEALSLIREAIEFHLEAYRDRGEAIPQPCSSGELVEIPVAS